ncbi:uncharacterized protein LOC134829002 [Culicoides brevitarsis]|uniref:uncharacterized protein LOC134829002 n=1 Tax=Culicoides brevitarsis TaxID=469753 RepID=UPI00307C0B58
MPTCPPAPTIPPKKCISTGDVKRAENGGGLLEPQLSHMNVGQDARWSKTAMCPPCKGVYTWMSPPKAVLGHRKISKLAGSQLMRKIDRSPFLPYLVARREMLTVPNRASEDLLATFGTENLAVYGNKPNAIVRPLQHSREKTPTTPGDGLVITDLEAQVVPKSPVDLQINGTRIGIGAADTDFAKEEFFSRQLDQKLRLFDFTKDSARSSRDELSKKPLFITTVPRGVFLQPTKTLPPLPKKIYTFSSRPKVLEFRRQTNLLSLEPSRSVSAERKADEERTKRQKRDSAAQGISLQQQQQTQQQLQNQSNYQNVMHDRRIIRGTNFNHLNSWNPNFGNAGLLSGKGEGDTTQKEYETKRRLMLRNKQLNRTNRNVIGTPPPCKGRKHEVIQTEKYLEELFDRPPELDACCQTDLFLQRPPTPKYVPGKVGVDVCTEIADGELFDFDLEVQPILETLVGRTLEQALIEVMHEEELADLKEQQQRLLAIREKEEAEIRRLEEQERRLTAEKKRRLAQEKLTKDLDTEMEERVTAAKLLQGHIADLLPGVLEDIEPLKEAADRDNLEEQLRPWLAQEVAEEIGNMIDSRDLLEEIVKQVLKHRAELYTNLHRARQEKEEMEQKSIKEEKDDDVAEIKDVEEAENVADPEKSPEN